MLLAFHWYNFSWNGLQGNLLLMTILIGYPGQFCSPQDNLI